MKHAPLKLAAVVLALAVPMAWAQASPLSVSPKTLALTEEDSTILQVDHKKWRKYKRYKRYGRRHRHRHHHHHYGHRRHYGPSFSFGLAPYHHYPYYGWGGPSFSFRIH